MKTKRAIMTIEEIDANVTAQAENDAAWEQPLEVKRSRATSVSLSASLAERAAFFARVHREKSLENWLKRIIQERLDVEEAAFSGFKREMLVKGNR
jgi:hypothetical protein